MQSALCIALTLALAVGVAPRGAKVETVAPATESDPADSASTTPEPEVDPAVLELAEAHWSEGRYSEARRTLQPLARDLPLDDRLLREKLLTVLADATVNDPALPEDERREQAAAHLNRIMDRDPTWRMPPNLFSYELFNLYLDLRMERAETSGEACAANLVACQSSVDNAADTLRQQEKKYAKLQQAYADQEIEVRDRVARSRVFAALPFGVGHFYNGDRVMGASLLAAEVAIGAAGLGLLLHRTISDRCDRRAGFQEMSVSCQPRNSDVTLDSIINRRKAEETMAWLFLGTVLLDLVIAQIRFRPFETASVRRVKRRDLERSGPSAKGSDPSPNRRSRKPRSTPRAKVRPSTTVGPHGGGLSVEVRF